MAFSFFLLLKKQHKEKPWKATPLLEKEGGGGAWKKSNRQEIIKTDELVSVL